MTGPIYDADRWLCAEDQATLEQAIRIAKQRGDKVTRDTCQRCGGQGCEQCTGPRDDYVPEYVRASVKKWRPTNA